MPGNLGQPRPQLTREQVLDCVCRCRVQLPSIGFTQLGNNRRLDERMREPVVAAAITRHQEAGAAALGQ